MGLDALLAGFESRSVTSQNGNTERKTAPAPCWRYLIRHADGALASHSFTPPATMAEVRGWYPDALSIEVEPDPAPGSSLEPAALHLEATA